MTVLDLLAETLDRMDAEGEEPRSLYLTDGDYLEVHRAASEAMDCETFPLSLNNIPIISEKLIDKVEVPVRPRLTIRRLASTFYSANGRPFPIRLP